MIPDQETDQSHLSHVESEGQGLLPDWVKALEPTNTCNEKLIPDIFVFMCVYVYVCVCHHCHRLLVSVLCSSPQEVQ